MRNCGYARFPQTWIVAFQVASITGRMPDCFFVATRVLRLDRWIPRKADHPRPTVTVAARAANIVEGNADRRIGVAALDAQIKVNNGVAGIARDDEPVMLRRKRGTYCRPEPCNLLRG